jgi:aminopeptidase N
MTKKTDIAQEVRLADYSETDYIISQVELKFWLNSTKTRVQSMMKLKAREGAPRKELVLDGVDLQLESILVNNHALVEEQYIVTENTLTIMDLPEEEFSLEIITFVNPEANTALDGLYKSGSIYCTQNEAQGFRKITYYLDRPDAMATFTTTIIANKKECPILLSNGNLVEQGDLDEGMHFAKWHDPFPKPCYLYALVAGDLGLVQDSYETVSVRNVDLRIYCDHGNENRCDHAMQSLKNSMEWDEKRFGLEYDLDIYMIVAVDSFNMGAMENKGLNVFNSAYVLADQQSATDSDFLGIESVIGHEYFHNWTGNRITCRDWFQLTLKEGLTVYRDQEFSADLNSRVVQRVGDVDALRVGQFAEDAGPTAHPIKPKSYIEINNFYTSTIYNKGAEVIRMIENFVGVDGFRKGMDKYFELYDGQAVTTEDFVYAMSTANNIDLEQFKLWYDQAGTPSVHVNESFDSGSYKINIRQELPATPGQPAELKKPQHFPLNFALLDSSGKEIEVGQKVMMINDKEHEFVFELDEKPSLSINRGFSAPVLIKRDVSLEEQYFLMSYDRDGFNRCEVATLLAYKMIDSFIEGAEQLDPNYKEAFKKILLDDSIDHAEKALMISLPGAQLIGQQYASLRIDEITKARKMMMRELMSNFSSAMLGLYDQVYETQDFDLKPESMGRRSLTNALLDYFSYGEKEHHNMIAKHYERATNMTDELGALMSLAKVGSEDWLAKRQHFYDKWQDNTLVMQKWIRLVAGRDDENIMDDLKALEANPVYDANVPNLIRSLWGAFMNNLPQFHHGSGRGYELMATKILEIDRKNPQLASRLSAAFRSFSILDEARKPLMKKQLERIIEDKELSSNVFEIVSLTLK